MSAATQPSHPARGRCPRAAGAFFIWGTVPLYWKQMTAVSAPSWIAHRIVWSLVFLFGIVAWQKDFAALRPGLATPRAFA